VQVIKELEQGLSSARNRGIEVAQGDIIAFTDDDVEFGRDWLKEIIKPFKDPAVWCVTGKVKPHGNVHSPTWLPSSLNFLLSVSDYGSSEKVLSGKEKPIGCNMAFRKEVFKTVGTFDPYLGRIGKKLRGGEEVLIYMKIRNLGRKAIYSPEAIVFHKIENKLCKEYVLDYAYWLGVSESYIERKNQKLRFSLKYIRSTIYLTIGYPTSSFIGQFVKASDSNIMYDRYLLKYCLGYIRSL
jgi:GT2 family glycosyltransferase